MAWKVGFSFSNLVKYISTTINFSEINPYPANVEKIVSS